MLYSFLIFHFFLSNTDGDCLEFSDNTKNNINNNCAIRLTNEPGFSKCLNCYIKRPMTRLAYITITQSCSPLIDLRCIEFHFNDTQTFLHFSRQYSQIINKLFGKTITLNTLFINIQYDSLDKLTRETILPLENIPNRSYDSLRLIMRNRGNRTILTINRDIEQTTFRVLQLYIHCSDTQGYDVFTYILNLPNQTLVSAMQCQLPTTTTGIKKPTRLTFATSKKTTKRTIKILTTSIPSIVKTTPILITSTHTSSKMMTSTKRTESRVTFMLSLILGGGLLPCLLLACCLYVICARDNQDNEKNIDGPRLSLSLSITDTISSSGSATLNKWA
jgi:hypothetical protein